jgi:hypothetical protein
MAAVEVVASYKKLGLVEEAFRNLQWRSPRVGVPVAKNLLRAPLSVYGVRTRIEQLQQQHRDRRAEIAESCQIAPKTIAELTSKVFRQPLDGHQMSFAYGEVAAHVNHLVSNGILENEQGRFQTTTTFRSLPGDRLP